MVLPMEFQDLSRTKSNDHIHTIFFYLLSKSKTCYVLNPLTQIHKNAIEIVTNNSLIVECSEVLGLNSQAMQPQANIHKMFNWKQKYVLPLKSWLYELLSLFSSQLHSLLSLLIFHNGGKLPAPEAIWRRVLIGGFIVTSLFTFLLISI